MLKTRLKQYGTVQLAYRPFVFDLFFIKFGLVLGRLIDSNVMKMKWYLCVPIHRTRCDSKV